MLENFIYAKLKSLFEEKLNNGEVLDEAIVFIEDTKEIWNHGTYFGGSKVDLSKLEEAISKIKTDGDGIMYLNDKGEYEIPLIIVDSEEELNSITPEIGTRAIVRTVIEGYDNLNLAEILNGEETNVPADMFAALGKYAFKVTSVDTSILFPYLEDDEHTVYKLFDLKKGPFNIVTNLDGSSIQRVYIIDFNSPLFIYNSLYWYDHNILECIITIDNVMSVTNLDQNVVDAFLLFSTALNVSIIANNEYIDYYYTSKGWVLSDYITTLLFLTFLSSFIERIPTRVSQLVNDSNYITKTEVADSYLVKGDYALKSDITEIKTQLGDINTILESIINGNPDTPDDSIKKMITFTVKSEMYPNLSTYTYEAEEGMTWEEFLNNSEYPIYPLHPQSFDSGTYVNCNGYDGNYVIYSSAKVAQLVSYTIIDGEVYTYHDEK